MVIGSRGGGSGSGVVWTSVSSEESKNRIMRAPPAGVTRTFVFPGNGSQSSAVLMRAKSEDTEESYYLCFIREQESATELSSSSSNPGNIYASEAEYSNNQYTIVISYNYIPVFDVLEYALVELSN